MSETYEGWTNMPTWSVNIAIQNDQELLRLCSSSAEEKWKDAKPSEVWTRYETAKFALANELEEWFTGLAERLCTLDQIPTGVVSPRAFADVLDGWRDYAGALVNWVELGEAYIDSYLENIGTDPRVFKKLPHAVKTLKEESA